jgi:NADPH-dependent curcumin reductase CurA
MTRLNRQIRLRQRPTGAPDDTTWNITEVPVATPAEGEVLLKVLYVSIDPAMRGWLNDAKSYIPPVQIDEVMRAGTVSQVLESRNPDLQPGDFVVGMLGVQQYAVAKARGLHKVSPMLAPLPRYLGVLGMPGMTAYFGILETGLPQAGETVVVSAAAGAVGAVVGQIAKIKGCYVVGIAGGPEKCRYIKEELHFDDAIDYQNENLHSGLKRACPKGVDVFFDNVGGDILDAVLTRLNFRARVVICGAISQYNSSGETKGPKNYLSLLVNRARMEGIVVLDNVARFGEAAREMAGWIAAGKLQAKEHIVEGLDNFPDALMMLFRGENFGKLILKVGDAEEIAHV